MQASKAKRNRMIAIASSILLIAALLLTGTFAFINPMQHRTNEFDGEGILFDATLVDHFDPADAENWRRGETIDKVIYVVNSGNNPNTHGPVFVRINLREFMQLMPTVPYYWGVAANGDLFQVAHANMFGPSTSRDVDAALFMVDTGNVTGNPSNVFVHIPSTQLDENATEAAVLAALQVIRPDITAQHEFVFTTDFVSGVEGWFVISRAGDLHGQYGRYMVSDVVPSLAEATLVGSNTPRATNQMFGVHGTNGECQYDIHLWNGAVLTSATVGGNDHLRVDGNLPLQYTALYRQWTQWLLSESVILLSAWNALTQPERDALNAGPDGGVWIIDDRAGAAGAMGWVYWSRQLEVDESTANFLEAVTLLEQPSGSFSYKIHVTMESVSREALWPDWPLDPPVETEGPEVEQLLVGVYNWFVDWDWDDEAEEVVRIEGWRLLNKWTYLDTDRRNGYIYTTAEYLVSFFRATWSFYGTDIKFNGIVEGENLSDPSETIWTIVEGAFFHIGDWARENPVYILDGHSFTGEYFELNIPDMLVADLVVHARPADAPDNDDFLRILIIRVDDPPV